MSDLYLLFDLRAMIAGGMLALMCILTNRLLKIKRVRRALVVESVAGNSEANELPEIGARGVASSDLKLAGEVEIDGRVYEAVSRDGYLAKGEGIHVLGADGPRVLVSGRVETGGAEGLNVSKGKSL